MSVYLNANIRRTSLEENRFFAESVFLDRLYLRCCREDIARACKPDVAEKISDPIGKGNPDEPWNFHELPFTWSERSQEWIFSGPFYSIALRPTCSRKDAYTWLDGLFAAESSSGALHHGPRFIHVLGVEDATEEDLVGSYHDDWVLWRNQAGRLYAVRLIEVTAGTVNAIELWKMIMYWTVTVPFMRLRRF